MSDDAYYEDTVQAELIRVIDQCNEAIRVITDEYYAVHKEHASTLELLKERDYKLRALEARLARAQIELADTKNIAPVVTAVGFTLAFCAGAWFFGA